MVLVDTVHTLIASAHTGERVLKALLIDDHALFREGLRYILSSLEADVELIQAESFENAVEVAQEITDIELILLDLSLPGTSGLQAIDKVKKIWEKARIVIVSGTATPNRPRMLGASCSWSRT